MPLRILVLLGDGIGPEIKPLQQARAEFLRTTPIS